MPSENPSHADSLCGRKVCVCESARSLSPAAQKKEREVVANRAGVAFDSSRLKILRRMFPEAD